MGTNLMGINMKHKLTELVIDLLGITVGCIVVAIGLNVFLIPNQIASGGIGGLGIVLYHLLAVPVGLTVLCFNIPLLIMEIKIMGINFAIRTVYGALLFSILIEVFTVTPNVTGDMLLVSIYGGIIVGLGLGIVFRFKGTTGGTALAGQLLQQYTGLTIGQAIIGFDLVIVALAGYFFDPMIALYALISLFVTSRVIDLVQQGIMYERAALIISDKSKEISQEIMTQMNRGITTLDAKGGYTGENREMILVVLNRTELSRLKYLVYTKDQRAFVIVANANEVLGEGFRTVDTEEI